ncbi:unnamed protein product [Rhizophagus irregularis]|uniref:Zinc finger bed domain-containing protein 1-like n=1 Tax=Rhizophagus irregularis TaxID=588596 RepID=A0A915Z9L2_9GLOM|nr:unnamed protein product [Rhizophagus irregularis]CAB5368331.1 unnamed protein product [Rhizophagus irregularis]
MESIISESEPAVNQTNKRKQTTLNHYMPSFTKQDQEELESLLVRAFCSTGLLEFLLIDGWSNINKAPIVNYIITTPKPIFYKSVYTKEEHHTGENIAKGIEECMISIGIDKFTAVITDNANNMKSAWRILKEKYADKIFLGCWAHGINLWVKDIMKHKWANDILEKAKRLALYFRNHQIPLATLRRIQKEKYGYEVTLTLTVETRWMSVFECLDHILKTKIAMRALLAEENIILNQEIKNYIIDDCFWEELKNLLEYSIDRAKYRWDNFLYNPAVIVAYRLDPRFNGELVNSGNWHDIIKEEIIRIAGKENEVQNLLKSRYPLLSSVAIKVLSIPASSAASKRNWSTYNFIHSKLRNRMVIDRAEKLVYIYWNIRILQELDVPLTVKELIKSGVKMSDLESDDEKLGEESDKELEGDIDSNFKTLTEYEENEFDLDLDD